MTEVRDEENKSYLAPAEAVAELRVRVLVEAARGRDRKIAPNVLVRLEVELVNGSGARLEALVRIF